MIRHKRHQNLHKCNCSNHKFSSHWRWGKLEPELDHEAHIPHFPSLYKNVDPAAEEINWSPGAPKCAMSWIKSIISIWIIRTCFEILERFSYLCILDKILKRLLSRNVLLFKGEDVSFGAKSAMCFKKHIKGFKRVRDWELTDTGIS